MPEGERDAGGHRLDCCDQGGEVGVDGSFVESLSEGGVVGGPGFIQELQAGFGDVGVDAAAVGRAQVAGEQATALQAGDQAGGGALAEDDRVGDLLHLQMPSLTVVLAAEYVEQRELPHAQIVPGLQGTLDVRLDPAVQQGEGCPSVGEGGQRGIRGGHGSGLLPDETEIQDKP